MAKKSSRRAAALSVSQALFSQGFGTRRDCDGLVLNGRVAIAGRVIDDPDEPVETDGLMLTVEGRDWPWHEKALILLHKPAGYECSQKPKHWPSVMTLLPPPLPWRSGGDLQPVGRLDQDTTGMLLLTDDGPFLHRISSPRHHVPKTYLVTCRHEIDDAQIDALLGGVVLRQSTR